MDTVDAFEKILDMCHGHPLAFSQCRRVVQRLEPGCGRHPGSAWEHYVEIVKSLGELAGESQDDKAYTRNTVLTTLELAERDSQTDAVRSH